MAPRHRRVGSKSSSVARAARAALEEDRFRSDRTTSFVLHGPAPAEARVVAQASGRLSGMAPALACARIGRLRVVRALRDGSRLRRGSVVLVLRGDARHMLGVERTLLNYLMHLSGIATVTAKTVERVRSAPHPPQIWATRKTTPGLRDLEKEAVVHGGGHPHRRDLSDAVLVKSNHLALVPLRPTLARVRSPRGRTPRIEVEVRNVREAIAVARAGVSRMLIDNATPARARAIVGALQRVGLRSGRWIELSGGLTPQNVRAYAGVGADALSLGALTHSAPALPFRMQVRPTHRA
ncbi:MAG TPA: carboxylating nicotinate-nucleotide diphosphorylase [Thermoplasmata archaeon]|nr:carboxylating nicotinate-nucleotide diphosphorylase [Thermoplasmata archaeon]